MAKQTAPMSLRLTPETEARLQMAADRLKIKKNKLAQDAIEAAVEAIEKNNYRLVVPIEFEVTHVPTSTGKTEAPKAGGERPAVRVGGRSSGSTARRPRYSLSEGEREPAPRLTDEPSTGSSKK